MKAKQGYDVAAGSRILRERIQVRVERLAARRLIALKKAA